MRKFATGGAIIPLLLFFLATNLVLSPTIHAQSPFYQGKSIRLIAGSQVGSLADLWPRLIADHMGKHIAGNPSIVVQNMPGAGSVIAANYIYNVAKPDGLTFGTLTPSPAESIPERANDLTAGGRVRLAPDSKANPVWFRCDLWFLTVTS